MKPAQVALGTFRCLLEGGMINYRWHRQSLLWCREARSQCFSLQLRDLCLCAAWQQQALAAAMARTWRV